MIVLFNLFSSELPNSFKIKKGLEVIGIDKEISSKTGEFLINKIITYIFDMKINNGEKTFDLEQDFKHYYYDFYKMGIDLIENDISWWKFNAILNGLFLDNDSAISKVIQYRTYKKPTRNSNMAEQEEYKFYMERKRFYSLEQEKNNQDENLNKLWKFIENKTKKEGDDLSTMQKLNYR